MFIHKLKKISLFKIYFWIIINIGWTLPLKFVKAQPACSCGPNAICNPLTVCSFNGLLIAITDIIVAIGLPIAVIFIIWAGFLFVSARGNEEQLKKAKKTFMWAIIGAMVFLGAKVIATAVKNTIESL